MGGLGGRSRVARGLATALVGLAATSCGEAGRDSVGALGRERVSETASAILGGSPAGSHHAVVEILRLGKYKCTGLLVTPDLVLTAAHCISVMENLGSDCGDDAGRMAITREAYAATSLRVVVDGVAAPLGVAVEEILVVAGFEDLPTCGRDLGMLRLAAPLPTETAALRLHAPPAVGETVAVVGYGRVTALPPPTFSGRMVREGVTVTGVGVSPVTLEAEWSSTEGPCAGDSGGPAFDAQGASIGIVSHGPLSCEIGIYQRLDTYAPWIRDRVRESSLRLDLPLPSWASPVPTGGEGATDAGDATGSPPSGERSSGCAFGARGRTPSNPGARALLLGMLVAAASRRRRGHAASGA